MWLKLYYAYATFFLLIRTVCNYVMYTARIESHTNFEPIAARLGVNLRVHNTFHENSKINKLLTALTKIFPTLLKMSLKFTDTYTLSSARTYYVRSLPLEQTITLPNNLQFNLSPEHSCNFMCKSIHMISTCKEYMYIDMHVCKPLWWKFWWYENRERGERTW